MTEVKWRVVKVDDYIVRLIGDVSTITCLTDSKHWRCKHTIVGKRTVTVGDQTTLALQWLCHRCAKELSGGIGKEAFIEMMTQANTRMGQGG